MACKTCDQTMHGLGEISSGLRYWWCPSCGTIKSECPSTGSVDWVSPANWMRAIDVLRRLMQGDKMDSIKIAARNILQDCMPLPPKPTR